MHHDLLINTVFSACPEVFPEKADAFEANLSLLRVSGGFSCTGPAWSNGLRSSPRVRRFFRLHPCRRSTLPVFSACPEVFLNKAENRPTGGGLLRVSGGFSRRLSLGVAQSQSSPRVRRFFQTCFSKPNREAVFSACPEVFLGRGAAAGTGTISQNCGRSGPPAR